MKLTWHGGKGARPKWVKEHLETGVKLDDLRSSLGGAARGFSGSSMLRTYLALLDKVPI